MQVDVGTDSRPLQPPVDTVSLALITANVGSIFEDQCLLSIWMEEFLATVSSLDAQMIALHCQEVGGKNYEQSMVHVERFVTMLMESKELADFGHVKIFLDEDFTSTANFTALGSLYFVRNDLAPHVALWNWATSEWVPLIGREIYSGSIELVPYKEKAKFPLDYFPHCKWSRKGYMRTRWAVGSSTEFDLVNIHLFHDASNLVSAQCFPSQYCETRRKALSYTLDLLEGNVPQSPPNGPKTTEVEPVAPLPYFIFGDFNFRLDTHTLMGEYTKGWQRREESDKSLIFSRLEPNSDSATVRVGKKLFDLSAEEETFFEPDKIQWLRHFDKELSSFASHVTEFAISFPPSYPFREDMAGSRAYMKTRCPSWCDRVLVSREAMSLIRQNEEAPVAYRLIGADRAMGDHKPVLLSVELIYTPLSDTPSPSTTLPQNANATSEGKYAGQHEMSPVPSIPPPPPSSAATAALIASPLTTGYDADEESLISSAMKPSERRERRKDFDDEDVVDENKENNSAEDNLSYDLDEHGRHRTRSLCLVRDGGSSRKHPYATQHSPTRRTASTVTARSLQDAFANHTAQRSEWVKRTNELFMTLRTLRILQVNQSGPQTPVTPLQNESGPRLVSPPQLNISLATDLDSEPRELATSPPAAKSKFRGHSSLKVQISSRLESHHSSSSEEWYSELGLVTPTPGKESIALIPNSSNEAGNISADERGDLVPPLIQKPALRSIVSSLLSRSRSADMRKSSLPTEAAISEHSEGESLSHGATSTPSIGADADRSRTHSLTTPLILPSRSPSPPSPIPLPSSTCASLDATSHVTCLTPDTVSPHVDDETCERIDSDPLAIISNNNNNNIEKSKDIMTRNECKKLKKRKKGDRKRNCFQTCKIF